MADENIRALSIQQPWAWVIVNGYKGIENRDWNLPGKYRGSKVLIHTGLKIDIGAIDWINSKLPSGIQIPTFLETGGIVGEALITGCVMGSNDPWFMGKYGFILEQQKAYDEMMPCKGALGFFKPDYTSKYKDKKPKHKPYRPSNGSEGGEFEAKYCGKCQHDTKFRKTQTGDDGCEIHLYAMNFRITDEQYPPEWIVGDNGPTCTKFKHEDDKPEAKPRPRCTRTGDMFGGEA